MAGECYYYYVRDVAAVLDRPYNETASRLLWKGGGGLHATAPDEKVERKAAERMVRFYWGPGWQCDQYIRQMEAECERIDPSAIQWPNYFP